MTIVWYYDPDKNPGRNKRALIGVPLRDLTDTDMTEMADHTKASIEASDLYRKTKPPGATDEQPAKPKAKAAPAPKTEAAPAEGAAVPATEISDTPEKDEAS